MRRASGDVCERVDAGLPDVGERVDGALDRGRLRQTHQNWNPTIRIWQMASCSGATLADSYSNAYANVVVTQQTTMTQTHVVKHMGMSVLIPPLLRDVRHSPRHMSHRRQAFAHHLADCDDDGLGVHSSTHATASLMDGWVDEQAKAARVTEAPGQPNEIEATDVATCADVSLGVPVAVSVLLSHAISPSPHLPSPEMHREELSSGTSLLLRG